MYVLGGGSKWATPQAVLGEEGSCFKTQRVFLFYFLTPKVALSFRSPKIAPASYLHERKKATNSMPDF